MRIPSLDDRIKATQRPTNQRRVMFQSWSELLFLHWEVDPAEVQATLPDGLTVDTHEGKTYLGVVPFYMKNIRPRFLPAVPGISNFLEMNVRAYVHDKYGRAGVWFYSLDADLKLAVRIARNVFKLPYFDAKMQAQTLDGVTNYTSQQKGSSEVAKFLYAPEESAGSSEPGSLEYFLTERYYLFCYHPKKQQLYSGRVYHEPYPLHEVKVGKYSDYPIELAGFARPGRLYDHAVMSRRVDVEIYPLQKVE